MAGRIEWSRKTTEARRTVQRVNTGQPARERASAGGLVACSFSICMRRQLVSIQAMPFLALGERVPFVPEDHDFPRVVVSRRSIAVPGATFAPALGF